MFGSRLVFCTVMFGSRSTWCFCRWVFTCGYVATNRSVDNPLSVLNVRNVIRMCLVMSIIGRLCADGNTGRSSECLGLARVIVRIAPQQAFGVVYVTIDPACKSRWNRQRDRACAVTRVKPAENIELPCPPTTPQTRRIHRSHLPFLNGGLLGLLCSLSPRQGS